MKKINIALTLMLYSVLHVWCQVPVNKNIFPFDSMPAETIQIHLNSTYFVTGESLLFSVYCYDTKREKLSSLSTVAYLEMVAEDGMPVAQMKVRLENGTGNGDYFFNSNIGSGNYTLIAYTKWMRNFSTSSFFRTTITIINPESKPLQYANTINTNQSGEHVINDTSTIVLQVDASSYGHRKKVTLTLTTDTISSFVFSTNARLMETPNQGQTTWRISTPPKVVVGDLLYLPEIRGEIISGTVTKVNTGERSDKTIITMSAPSDGVSFQISTTDSSGRYYFNGKDIRTSSLLLQVHKALREDYIITPEDGFLKQYREFTPVTFKADSTLLTWIGNRYLSNQIGSIFLSQEKESVTSTQFNRFFKPDKIYNLNEFTQFPTMEDVFREIIPEVVVKLRDANFSLLMYNSASGFRFTNSPLILIDGVVIENPNLLMNYDPANVRSISLVTQHYYYGGLEMDGIISVETWDGNANKLPVNGFMQVAYTHLSQQEELYFPDYETDKSLDRIPDFRTQLYWNPRTQLNKNSTHELSFYTGDVKGKYIIEVAGITSAGKKVYLKKIVSVQ